MSNKQASGVVRIGDLVRPLRNIITFSWDDPEHDRDWIVSDDQIGLVVGLERRDAVVLFHATVVNLENEEVGDPIFLRLWVHRTDLKVLKRC